MQNLQGTYKVNQYGRKEYLVIRINSGGLMQYMFTYNVKAKKGRYLDASPEKLVLGIVNNRYIKIA